MGQHKMDEDFNKKLSQREISPSENAWDRLNAMLTVAEEKKPKRDFSRLYIAASILGFIFLGTIYLSQTPEIIDVKRNNVVFEQHQKPAVKKSDEKKSEPLPTIADSESIAEVTPTKTKSNQSNQSINPKTNSQKTITNPIEAINQNPKDEPIASNANANQKSSIISQKPEQPANAKVDELLANAQTVQKSGSVKPSVKVNAKSLLSQVDGEVNLTFREKMLRTINRNYQEVADAVSTRNIQQ